MLISLFYIIERAFAGTHGLTHACLVDNGSSVRDASAGFSLSSLLVRSWKMEADRQACFKDRALGLSGVLFSVYS